MLESTFLLLQVLMAVAGVIMLLSASVYVLVSGNNVDGGAVERAAALNALAIVPTGIGFVATLLERWLLPPLDVPVLIAWLVALICVVACAQLGPNRPVSFLMAVCTYSVAVTLAVCCSL